MVGDNVSNDRRCKACRKNSRRNLRSQRRKLVLLEPEIEVRRIPERLLVPTAVPRSFWQRQMERLKLLRHKECLFIPVAQYPVPCRVAIEKAAKAVGVGVVVRYDAEGTYLIRRKHQGSQK